MKLAAAAVTMMAVMISAAGIFPAYAKDETPQGWGGDAGLGFVSTTGNTETETINAKATLVYGAAPWKHTAKLDLLKGSDNDETNADRVAVSGKTERNLSEVSYVFGLINYEDDEFSGYDYRASETLGYGRRLLQGEAVTLNAEAGLGARQDKLSDTGESEGDGIVRLAGLFKWRISPAATFIQELEGEGGGGRTVTRSLSALSAQIVGNLAAKFGVRITHTSDVPSDIDKTDTETSTTLVYEF
ncbi:MAG: YdiY family protein [Acetobacteraceae bacterium]